MYKTLKQETLMLKKYTKTEIKKKSVKCAKCGKKITIAFVKDNDENILCNECRKGENNEN